MAANDLGLRRLKAEHLKKRAEAALREGNYREAWTEYTEALNLLPDKASCCKVYCNRSLAYLKGLRPSEALEDAEAAILCKPEWCKAHWRRGAALKELKRIPDAVSAFHTAWQLSKGTASEEECDRMLWAMIQRLTREQLCQGILAKINGLVSQGTLVKAEKEAVTEGEMLEAAFRSLAQEHRGCPKPGPYYRSYQRWLREGMPAAEAYIERAAIHSMAKCYLQARVDAQAAVDALAQQKSLQRSESTCMLDSGPSAKLVVAYLRLGDAFMAEKEHPDRDCSRALEAFMRGLDADPRSERLLERRTEADGELTGQQITAVLEALREGNTPNGRPPDRLFRVDIALRYSKAVHRDFSAAAREALRAAVGRLARAAAAAVSIEGVRRLVQKDSAAGIVVRVCVETGPDVLAAQAVLTALKENPEKHIGGEPLTGLLGQMDASALEVEIVDITPRHHTTVACTEQEPHQQDLSIVPAQRPKLELELPYRMYKLVKADGGALERPEKHPFCMSRVFYDGVERPEEAWAELADSSCRWRQTGSEVKIIVLKVPSEVRPRELAVSIEPFHIRVAHAISGEVFLEGDLERGIVPEDSVWMHGGGNGEDGCLLLLRKMNLELLRRHWMHSEMWWPRLFTHHGDIAWDDYEKDYSDLPEEVLEPHRAVELARDARRRIEAAEKDKRELLQERDDLRKRTRQERLHYMRFGVRKSWVQLHRESMAVAC